MVKLKKNSFLKLRLQGKYSLAIFALVAWVVLLLSTILLYHFTHSMEIMSSTSAQMMDAGMKEQMRTRAKILVGFVAENLATPMYQYDFAMISEIVEVVRSQKDVVYVYVYEKDGRLVHDGTAKNERANTVLDDSFSVKAVAAKTVLLQESGSLLDVAQPVTLHNQQAVGGVRIGLSLATLEGEIDAMREQLQGMAKETIRYELWLILLVSLLALVAALLVAISITNRLVTPIRALARMAEQLGQGGLPLKPGQTVESMG